MRDARKREQEEKASSSSKKAAAAKGGDPPPKEWTREELTVLAKSVVRYPAGFSNRWGMVAAYLNDQLKPTESLTADECMVGAHKAAKASGATSSAAGGGAAMDSSA